MSQKGAQLFLINQKLSIFLTAENSKVEEMKKKMLYKVFEKYNALKK